METRPTQRLDLWPAPTARGPVDARIELPGSKSLTNRALVLAAVDTEGRPGVAWRAKNVASGTRREAKHRVKQAKLEARLAAKSIGQ